MTSTEHDIAHLLRLARLHLSADETEALSRDLDRILQFVAAVREVDTDGVEPMTHATLHPRPPREDVARPGIGRHGIAQSTGARDGLVEVPRVIE